MKQVYLVSITTHILHEGTRVENVAVFEKAIDALEQARGYATTIWNNLDTEVKQKQLLSWKPATWATSLSPEEPKTTIAEIDLNDDETTVYVNVSKLLLFQ